MSCLSYRKDPSLNLKASDCQFHECVDPSEFNEARTLKFVPPDHDFELMR